MKNRGIVRSLCVVASAALIVGAFAAGPAHGKKKKPKGCPAVTPVEPASDSQQTAEVLEVPVVKVTDAHTAEAPLVFEYTHGPAFWTILQEPVQEDTVFFNIQVDPAAADTGLYVRQEWAALPGTDMDLYVWDAYTGEQATNSGSSNLTPVTVDPPSPAPHTGVTETGAWGFESVSGFPVSDCAGFVIESRAFTTKGEDMSLKVWLGEQVVE
jgi:hypothetical protein